MVVASAVLTLTLASAGAPDECCEGPGCAIEPGALVASSKDPGRRLRADFEPPDAMVIVNSRSWPIATAALFHALAPRVQTIVLEDTAEAEFFVTPEPNDDGLLIDLSLNSGWVRDYGPLQVRSPQGITWLNAGYYSDRPADDDLPRLLAQALVADVAELPLALEGGAIISNGAGLCASTATSASRAEIDFADPPYLDAILDELGCRAWAIVPALENDETGHVDMFAQFVSRSRVLVASVAHSHVFPVDARSLDDAAAILVEAARSIGLHLEVTRVPTPVDKSGRYLTYVNGARIAGALLVPHYRDVASGVQHRAYEAIRSALDGDALIEIPADELIALGGAVHCATLGVTLPISSPR